MRSGTENRLKAALEVLKEKMVRRQISLKALREGPILPAAKGTVRQTVHINRGINEEKARELTKFIKKSGLKVQTQIQGDQLRVSAKKKDDLQEVIAAIKAKQAGMSGSKVALIAVVGGLCIPVVMFGILAFGFSSFG